MLDDNKHRTAKVIDSIDELDVSIEDDSGNQDANEYKRTKEKIVQEVNAKSQRIQTEQKQKNVLKLGFIPPGLWDKYDAKYCLASDKQQEQMFKS